jgi:hypothetical protein
MKNPFGCGEKSDRALGGTQVNPRSFIRETPCTVHLANAVAASIVQCSVALVAPPFSVFCVSIHANSIPRAPAVLYPVSLAMGIGLGGNLPWAMELETGRDRSGGILSRVARHQRSRDLGMR